MSGALFALPGNEELGNRLAERVPLEMGAFDLRHFPDGETYLRIRSDVKGGDLVLLCSLDRPDSKILPLLFMAETVRELGAKSVGLLCPYLGYMRQDQRFMAGEAVTSSHFAKLLSDSFDWLVTVDPHLHRRKSLSEIYSIPTMALQAAPLVSAWIRHNIPDPLLVGPDSESTQWVAAVAEKAGAPFIVLNKIRHGDNKVEISVPDIGRWSRHTPVLVDDIISTAGTMIETVRHLKKADLPPVTCVGIHAVFAEGAYEELLATGVRRIVTCNSIAHPTNKIELSDLLVPAVRDAHHRDSRA